MIVDVIIKLKKKINKIKTENRLLKKCYILILFIVFISLKYISIYKQEKFDLLNESLKKAKYFILKNFKGILIHNITKFISYKNPKVSAVIPVYNSKKYIARAIRSIQNQNIFNLEIILIDDCSKDDTISFIKDFQKKDSRIIIIRNKKNMGILYSRSIGTLSAKGKYIFPLDNDDMFLDKDVFEIITNIADKGNFDIVEFKGIYFYENKLNYKAKDLKFCNHKLNHVMFQSEMSEYPIRPANFSKIILVDVYLWAKCIKTKIYKKALNKLGEEKYSRYLLAHEDVIAMIFLFNTANSYKFVGKYGILKIKRRKSAYFQSQTNITLKISKQFFLIDVFFDFAKNTEQNIKTLVYLIYNLMNEQNLNLLLSKNNNYKILLHSFLNRILNSININEQYKIEIRKKGKIMKFIDYPF